MKTSELTGAALNWAVAKCEGHNVFIKHAPVQVMYTPKGKRNWYIYTPSTNWAQGGSIIERNGIDTIMVQRDLRTWAAEIYETPTGYKRQQATTPLIAAMRCYVASKMGDEIEIPKELL